MSSAYASDAFVHRLLGKALTAGASDVHLKVGKPPGARVRGELVYFKGDRIVPEDTRAAAKLFLGSDAGVVEAREIVAGYDAPDVGRFRVSAFLERGAISIVMRAMPRDVPTFAGLGVPAAASALADKRRGLVVVTGAAGQGKTSTVAAMVGHLNASQARHIVTIEDPIEIEHEGDRGSVSQREIGADTASFASGIRAAARQDADVVVVSELREPEAMEAVIDAVEAGRLVIAVVAAPSATHAIARLFALGRAAHDLAQRLADAIEGVVAQRLSTKRDGSGRALACEILVATPAVRDAIARGPEGLAPKLRELMERGAAHGMSTFDPAAASRPAP